jgi:SPP1 family predicted phage head-tail adaptor
MKCCDITPASLNRQIEIQSLAVTPTDAGGFTESWVTLTNAWAKIKNASGTELIHADQLGAVAFSDFTIRYRSDLNESMRVIYRGTEFQVRHINNIEEADKFLIIKAERGVSQ